jgi:hypothetical protein
MTEAPVAAQIVTEIIDPDPSAAAPPAAPEDRTPRGLMRHAGYDPDVVKAVLITGDAVIAIAADYPEPYVPPEA